MEFVEGKTLDEIEGPQLGQLVLIFCQVVSAMTTCIAAASITAT